MKNILSNIKSCCCSSSLGFPKGALSDLIRNVYFDQETRDIVIEFIVGDDIKKVRISIEDLLNNILELIVNNLNRTVYKNKYTVVGNTLILIEEQVQSVDKVYTNNFSIDNNILSLNEIENKLIDDCYRDQFFIYNNILELGEIIA